MPALPLRLPDHGRAHGHCLLCSRRHTARGRSGHGMSDTSQGPGWWLASDGKWYPPELWTGPPNTGPGRSDGAAGANRLARRRPTRQPPRRRSRHVPRPRPELRRRLAVPSGQRRLRRQPVRERRLRPVRAAGPESLRPAGAPQDQRAGDRRRWSARAPGSSCSASRPSWASSSASSPADRSASRTARRAATGMALAGIIVGFVVVGAPRPGHRGRTQPTSTTSNTARDRSSLTGSLR